MAAIVCHGLPSCLDSQIVDSKIHNIRLPSPKPLNSHPIDLPFKTCFWESNTKPNCEKNVNKIETMKPNSNEDSWSSIQELSKSNASKDLKEQTYVNPNVKLPWLRLSPKSLELCTENLGNETGSDILERGIDFMSSIDSTRSNFETKKISCQNLRGEKGRSKEFPPPLKSMRGSECVRVKPHRENGRLVMELTKVAASVSCFQAERSNGRLRLSFWNDSDNNEEDDTKEMEEENEEEVVVVVEEEEDGISFVEDENENDEGETHGDECKERKGKSRKVESEMRMEKYERGGSSRRRRCKEGNNKHENKEMLVINWGEPLWLALATS